MSQKSQVPKSLPISPYPNTLKLNPKPSLFNHIQKYEAETPIPLLNSLINKEESINCKLHNKEQLNKNQSCKSNQKKQSLETVERKLRRQSFFAHVCCKNQVSTKSPLSTNNTEKFEKIKSDFDRKSGYEHPIQKNQSRTKSSNDATNTSLHTADTLQYSLSDKCTESKTDPKPQFFNLNLKKVSIVRKNNKEEFLALSANCKVSKCSRLLDLDLSVLCAEFEADVLMSDDLDKIYSECGNKVKNRLF